MEHQEESANKLTPAKIVGDDIFGYMAGAVKIVGDVVGPITPLEDWEWVRSAAR